jgi:glycosyltransferase involved in cell wall biosynthesis
MLNVITFSVTGARAAAVCEDGPAGAESCPQAVVEAVAAANSRAAGIVRTSTAVANWLPADKDEQAGALQRLTPVIRQADVLDATVLVCTYNRAALLAELLDSLRATVPSGLTWDVIVVDNNSTDETRRVVTSRMGGFPVPLKYLFEPRQGKSVALNTGLAATDAAVVVFTDDDVQVSEHWLDASCRRILDDSTVDYTGGPVFPIWERPRPSWLDGERCDLWGTLAILDYGEESFVFEERRRVPLGANMAVRRSLIDRIGGFDPSLGRKGHSLLGQEQAEFFCRSRAVGARGVYVPAASVRHHVPATRLTRDYFLRWWYWKGVSKALLEQRHPVTDTGVDLTRVPTVAGVPRFLFGSAVRDLFSLVRAAATFNGIEIMKRLSMLCYFTGYLKGVRQAQTAAGSIPANSSVA